MKYVITNKEGHCPYCDSEDIDFGESTFLGNYVRDDYVCNHCGENFTQFFNLIYTESIGDRQIDEE